MDLTLKKPEIDYKKYGLNSKQARFVRLMLDSDEPQFKVYQDVYGTKSVGSATAAAARLLGKDNVKQYMDALESRATLEAVKNNQISKERVLKEEACLAFLDIGALVDEDGFFIQNIKLLPEEVRRAITGLEISEKVDPFTQQRVPYYKLKFSDKGRALERLEKHLGMLRERVEIGVEMTLKGLIAQIDGKKRGEPMIPHLGGKEE